MHEGKVTGTQQLISKVVKIKSFFFYIDVMRGNFIMFSSVVTTMNVVCGTELYECLSRK